MSKCKVLCMAVAVLGLTGCGLFQTREPVQVTNHKLMAVVESNARSHGAQVVWVNPPTVRNEKHK